MGKEMGLRSGKKAVLVLVLSLFCLTMIGCGHEHSWSNPTCVDPQRCTECGEIQGAPLGHDWFEATCTEAKKCSRCGATNGVALGHDFAKATCTEGEKCNRCGLVQGIALGHEFADATCTESKRCIRCGQIEGQPLGHDYIEATCTEPKTCIVCGAFDGGPLGHEAEVSCTESVTCSRCGEEILPVGHDWIEATCTEAKKCVRCGLTEGKALGHEPSEPRSFVNKEATCTEPGETQEIIICSRCLVELSNKSIAEPPLGHTTDNGTCTRCGREVYKKVTGKGDDVISDISVGDGIYKVHFTNSGSSNFIVWIHDYDGDKDLAVNEIGKYDGYVYLSGQGPYMFEIESSGSWSYTIERIGYTDETALSGKGDYVSDIISTKTGTWRIKHNGKSNFIVWAYTTDGRDLLVNEIGKYDGRKLISVPKGSSVLLVILADGEWSIVPE